MSKIPKLSCALLILGTTLHAADKDVLTLDAKQQPIYSAKAKKLEKAKWENKEFDVPHGIVFVPAGAFNFRVDREEKKVELPAFCIGRYEVTNAQYKEFVDETNPRQVPKHWQNRTYPEGRANHPVLFVSYDDAQAYCAWLSKQTGWKVALPTAEQWEKAARGPQSYLYPWGNEKDSSFRDGKLKTHFNYNAYAAAHYLTEQPDLETSYVDRSNNAGVKVKVKDIVGSQGRPLAVTPDGNVTSWIDHKSNTGFVNTKLYRDLVDLQGGLTTPVGTFESGKSAYGAYDMAGNAYEWTSTTIIATNGAEKGKEVLDIRGGSWYSTGHSGVSVGIGEGRRQGGAYHSVGFRVVMTR